MTKSIRNDYKPDFVTPPGETLQQTLDALGMSKAELANRIGKTQKFVIDIIKHEATITPATAMQLEKALGIPASFWNNRERRFRESLARKAERKKLKEQVGWLEGFPLKRMIKDGWIKRHNDKIEQLNEVLLFFAVASPRQWEGMWLSPGAAYRRSKAFVSKPQACSAWLRRGELKAQGISCSPYDRGRFRSALTEIRGLTRSAPEHFESRTVELCRDSGVAVAFTPHMPGAPVNGATRWLTPQKAMIQLSLRGKWEDILWFTFFHEAGHILLHGKKDIFVETDDREDEKENQADRFAANFLISNAVWQRFVASGDFRAESAVKDLAAEQKISPAVVVGRLQHEGLIPHSHLNGLRRRFDIVSD